MVFKARYGEPPVGISSVSQSYMRPPSTVFCAGVNGMRKVSLYRQDWKSTLLHDVLEIVYVCLSKPELRLPSSFWVQDYLSMM